MPTRRDHLLAAVTAMMVALGLLGLTGLGVAAQDEASYTAELDELDDSGVTGTVVLTADGDQTVATLSLDGAEEGYEGHIFNATCEDHLDAVDFYPLDAVDADGQSETTIDAQLSDLISGDYWAHVHRPASDGGDGVACGQILAAATGGNLPSTGVGSAGDPGLGVWLVFALAAGFAALGGSRVVRRRGSPLA